MQVMTEKAVTSSVAEIFPCSTGTDHRVKETQVVIERIIENPATAPQVSCLKCLIWDESETKNFLQATFFKTGFRHDIL